MGHPQRPILVADKCEHFFLGRFTRFFDGREMKITKNHISANKMLNILIRMIGISMNQHKECLNMKHNDSNE